MLRADPTDRAQDERVHSSAQLWGINPTPISVHLRVTPNDYAQCATRIGLAQGPHALKRATLFSVLLCACVGDIAAPGNIDNIIGGGGGPGGETNPCTADVVVGSMPIRRLSHEEYAYSLSDTFTDLTLAPTVTTAAQGFAPDPQSLGFNNSSAFLTVSSNLAQQYMDAAETISAQAVQNLSALLPCSPTNNESGCADRFIQVFGRKMFRRAIAADEAARYRAVYDGARTAGYDFATGIQFVVFAFLNSPNFLYRMEFDTPGSTGTRAVTGTELASRLSYLLWHSVPDEELLTTAEMGQLRTKDQVLAQARRMLSDPKARRVYSFFQQWLGLQNLPNMQRDPTEFPNLDPNLPSLLDGEARAFVEGVMFDGDSKFQTLLTAQYTYANQKLATHYGFSGISGSTWQKVDFATPRRGGLFMLGGTLAVHDKSTRTSIVRRGLEIRTQVMCQIVPAPPPNVPALGTVDPTATQAERLAQHRTDPNCASCHTRLDPLGQTFEAIDAVGRDRTVDEGGHPVVTTGAISESINGGVDGPVADGYEMMQKLAGSEDAQDCMATQLYRFAAGRKEETGDACSRFTLRAGFKSSGGDLKGLLLGLTQTDDFMNRQVTPP